MLKQIRWNVLCNAAENGLRVVSAYAFQAGASGFSHSRVQQEKAAENCVGASRILLDAHIPFDIVDAEMDWSGCRFPLLPDEVLLFPVFARKR